MVDPGTVVDVGSIGLLEGDRYIAYRRIEDLGTGNSEDILFRNPSGSGLHAAIDAPIVASTARVGITLTRNVTVSDTGTTIEPHNARIGAPDDNTMLVNEDATASGGTILNNPFSGAGGGGNTAAAGSQSAIGLLVEPDNNFRLVVTNNTNSSIDVVHIEVDFTEFDTDLIAP